VKVVQGDATDVFATERAVRDALLRAWDHNIVAQDEITRLAALLDHYRGTCDDCGRENVLLEADADGYYYEGEPRTFTCWQDPEECRRIVEERQEAERAKHSEAAKRGWEERRARMARGEGTLADMLSSVYGDRDLFERIVFQPVFSQTKESYEKMTYRFVEWDHMRPEGDDHGESEAEAAPDAEADGREEGLRVLDDRHQG
jgi:hypothetical protein